MGKCCSFCKRSMENSGVTVLKLTDFQKVSYSSFSCVFQLYHQERLRIPKTEWSWFNYCCEVHYSEDQIQNTDGSGGRKRKRLKKNALPDVVVIEEVSLVPKWSKNVGPFCTFPGGRGVPSWRCDWGSRPWRTESAIVWTSGWYDLLFFQVFEM